MLVIGTKSFVKWGLPSRKRGSIKGRVRRGTRGWSGRGDGYAAPAGPGQPTRSSAVSPIRMEPEATGTAAENGPLFVTIMTTTGL